MIPPLGGSDVLLPTEEEATAAWAARVRADHEQVDRCRESADPADFYAPHARRFVQDPQRTDDPGLDALLALAEPGETWLDIGAGAGRYSLPLALKVGRVLAVDPSPAMLSALREAMDTYGIDNIDVTEGLWPAAGRGLRGDVALMAHVGYDIAEFGAFLDAAEAAVARRCVVVMRAGTSPASYRMLWPEIHGEERVRLPMLPELLVLLAARGSTPEVTLVDRQAWGYDSIEELTEACGQMLWLRPGSPNDRRLRALVAERATQHDGQWELDWTPVPDGIVTWTPHRR